MSCFISVFYKRMSKKKVLVIPVVLMFVLSIPLGVLSANTYSKFEIYQYYRKQVVLKEDVILDDVYTTEKFGTSVILPAGVTGYISDKVDYWGDELGYENIDTSFVLDDGNYIDIAVSIKEDAEPYDIPTIDISRLDNAQTILSEYNQSREKYTTRVNSAKVVGVVIGVAFSLLLSLLFFIIKTKQGIKGKSNMIIFGVASIIDVILILGLLISFVFLNV